MDVNDYLVDQAGKDWAELLSNWSEALPASFTVWLVNRFGDVFFVSDDGAVHLLDVGRGVVERLADSRDDFIEQMDVDGNAEGWLLIPLVDECVAGGMALSPNQCYGYKVPPILGGEYAVENVVPTDLAVHYSFLGDLFTQTRNLPDGTRIRVEVKTPD
ncbi:MAG: DUF1851 domain-containing protein [Bryobacteraceae bacterium]|nr:DUF1851 domain-containing protein [Bryobacteraceae bacterium]